MQAEPVIHNDIGKILSIDGTVNQQAECLPGIIFSESEKQNICFYFLSDEQPKKTNGIKIFFERVEGRSAKKIPAYQGRDSPKIWRAYTSISVHYFIEIIAE